MPAGTIALTNNSATVTGSGTSFTTELKVNDFVVSTVGGVAYTLGVKSIESNTSLTLMEIYTGPSASGQSWTPVPYGTMAAITAQLAAQVTYAVRGFNLDKVNWQQIFTGSGTVTVTLPDGTSWQGPSWGYMATQFDGKANTSDVLTKADNLNSLTDKATARTNLGLGELATLNGPLAIDKGGTGGTSAADARTNLGLGNVVTYDIGNSGKKIPLLSGGNTEWSSSLRRNGYATEQGAWGFIANSVAASAPTGQVNGGGKFVSQLSSSNNSIATFGFEDVVNNYSQAVIGLNGFGTLRSWQFRVDGSAYALSGSWVNSSDSNVKENQAVIENPLDIMRKFRGKTWIRKDSGEFGIGFIAQEVQEVFPEAVKVVASSYKLPDGSEIKNYLGMDTGSIGAGLHHEAILALMAKIDEKDAVIAKLQQRMKAIDGLDA